MEITKGFLMFYGGIAGIVIMVLISIITILIMGKGKRKLNKNLNDIYYIE